MNNTALLRWSLVAVWLGTAAVSAHNGGAQGLAMLQQGGVPGPLQAWALWGGVALDAVLGLWLAFAPSRWAYRAAFAAVLLLTAVATVLLPGLWLHPIGPLLKNLPILALLWSLQK